MALPIADYAPRMVRGASNHNPELLDHVATYGDSLISTERGGGKATPTCCNLLIVVGNTENPFDSFNHPLNWKTVTKPSMARKARLCRRCVHAYMKEMLDYRWMDRMHNVHGAMRTRIAIELRSLALVRDSA